MGTIAYIGVSLFSVISRAEEPEPEEAGCFWSRSRLKKKKQELQFYMSSLWGKKYFDKLNLQSRAGGACFGPLEPEPLENKTKQAGVAWEKNQEPEPLKN